MCSAPITPNEQAPEKKKPTKQIIVVLLLVLCLMAFFWIVSSRTRITTDNAFIEGPIHPVASRVAGTVIAVHVRDNQQVKKGDLLVELDQNDYQIGVARSEAELTLASNEAMAEQIQVKASKAQLATALAQLQQSTQDLNRGRSLFAKEVIPKETLEKLETAASVAQSRVTQAKEQVSRDQAIAGSQAAQDRHGARVKRQQALLAEQRLKLGYTRIVAPSDGYVTRKNIEVGTVVQTGQPLLAIVPGHDLWVIANLKESQLRALKTGQQVRLRIDAYPDLAATGTVDSIMAGTGAAFSLLPPENATGNYVKVVQRVPVKIILNKDSVAGRPLRVGMSVLPTIDTGLGFLEALKSIF